MLLYASNTFVGCNYPLEEADVVFLGIPFVSTSVSAPALYGPLVVRESLKLTEDYIRGVHVFGKKKVCDLGDIEVVPGSYELTAHRIRETIADIRNANKKAFLVFVGGEHLVTLPIAEALKPRTIVQFDAHADCRKAYLGNAYMHQTWAYHASSFSRIVQVGVTSRNSEEEQVMKKRSIGSMTPSQLARQAPKLKHVHLSVDMDVFADAKTGLPEGQMQLGEALSALTKLRCSSMDITEIAAASLPSRTGFAAARLMLNVLRNNL